VRKTIALLSAALLAAFVVAGVRLAHAGREQAAKACPSGYMTQGEIEAAAQRAGAGEAGELSGGSLDSVCVSAKHPEKLLELIQRQEEQKTVRSAPYSSVAPGAYANAVNQHQNLGKNGPKVTGTSGVWSQYGNGPLIVNDPRYGSVNGLGLVYNEGRIDNLRYEPVHKRLFATKGTSGIWLSEDLGDHWRSIGDTLPSQVARDHFSFCFISDRSGVDQRDAIGVDNITWECDYPHSDSEWPHSPESVAKQMAGVDDAVVNKLTHENAMRIYQFDPFKHRTREQSTVAALRREVPS